MTLKLHHPWWAHLPALGCVVASAVLLATADAPARVPVHFGFSGQADRFGSIVELWIGFVVFPLLFTLGGVVLDEVYARHEQRRGFNWLSLIDEALAGFFLGQTVLMRPLLSTQQPVLDGVLLYGLIGAGGAILAATLLEFLRPYRPPAPSPLAASVQPDAATAAQMATPSARWAHWEKQDPLYLRLVVPISILAMLAGIVSTWSVIPWLTAALLPAIALLAACYGGMHVSVNRQRILVRLGAIGIPLLRVRLADLQSVEVADFNPLGDFGGWGLRYSFSKRMWGFFLAGSRGVVITTRRGKRVLIGSNAPETLAAVCESARKLSADIKLEQGAV